MEVTLLGTGSGIPQPGRSQPAVLVRGESPLLLDCGSGTILRMTQSSVGFEEIGTVLLTHLHLDHVSDLIALANARYLSGLSELEIHGPEGTYSWWRTLHEAYPYLERMSAVVHELQPGDHLEVRGFSVLAERASHSVTALAFRLEQKGRSVVYSGDTEPSPDVAALAEGADLLIHECSFPEPFKVTNHSTPMCLGEVLGDVGRVVLTHFYPQAGGHESEMARQVEEVSGLPTRPGFDLMRLSV
ncbi:MAG: MBL fold metallo-hydrolase [Methanothrix sp.]|nr:MBL fold metallo-hydrolase [Methanothrix sp.]